MKEEQEVKTTNGMGIGITYFDHFILILKKFLIEFGIYAVKCCKNAVKIAFFTVFSVFRFDILQH